MSKHYNLKTFPWGCGGGGHAMSKSTVIGPLYYDEQNDYLKILIGRFWGKWAVEGA